MKHGKHPREIFSRHQKSSKHIDANKTKFSVLKIIHEKGNIRNQLKRGFMNKKAENEEEENKSVITKFFKITYFLAKKKWAVKNNFSDIVEFLKDIGDKEIVNFLNGAQKNATYTSKFTVEDYICYISDYLEEELIDNIKLAEDFSLLADDSTDEADRSELSIFVHYVDLLKHCPVEKLLGITQVVHSKTAADLVEIINNFFIEKGIDISKINFTGLDGMSTMSSGKVRLLQCLQHFSPYSIYLNCRNHQLALCLVHLVKQFPELFNFLSQHGNYLNIALLKIQFFLKPKKQ